MELLRIEETQKYGYLLKQGDFEKFFDDEVTGGKDKTLKCVITYLNNAPRLYPNREIFQTQEFKDFVESISSSITNEFAQFNDLRIDGIVTRTKIKDGVRTSFWELSVVDHNSYTHTFDYNLEEYPTKEDVINKFNEDYNLKLTYEG